VTNIVYLSQIIPLNTGVPKLSPPSWPYTSGTYSDTGTNIKSAFYNTSLNPAVITINNASTTIFNTTTIKTINCYEIHDAPTATLSSIASDVYEVKNIQWAGDLNTPTNTNSVLNRLYPSNNTIESYLEVTASTKGNRVCLEGNSALSNIMSGQVLDTAHDYFVLLHADNPLKHHIAKITEITNYEINGDGFDFSPKYDEEVTKGTKIAIYKGPADTDTHIVAVGYGLSGTGGGDEYRHDTYVEVSKPTFYFYEDRCNIDKLKANTKYKIIKNMAYITGGNLTFDFGKKSGLTHSLYHTSSPNLQKHGMAICFKTKSTYGDYVVDKSRYTQFGIIHDNLKINDETITQASGIMKQQIVSVGDSIQNGSSVWTQGSFTTIGSISLGEWHKCFYNMMRDTHHANSTSLNLFNSDIKRYVEYDDADDKNNYIPQVSNVDMYNSIIDIGNFAEINIPDPNKIIGFKLNVYDNFTVKEVVSSEAYSGHMDIPLTAKVNSEVGAGWDLTFSGLTPSQDLRTIWGSSPIAALNPDGSSHSNTINKLRIGQTIFVGDFNSAPWAGEDGYQQVFTPTHRRNYKSENTWIACTGDWSLPQCIDGTAFVYTYNLKSDLFMGTFPIDTTFDGTNLKRDGNIIGVSESFLNNSGLLIRDKEMTGMNIPISYGDKDLNYIKPKGSITDRYQMQTRNSGGSIANVPSIYSYINGGVILENIVFKGGIESVEDKIEGPVATYKISGRDDITRLLDMVVNENYTHSNDYIYSTRNPNNDLLTPTQTWNIKDFDIGSTSISIFHAVSHADPTADGDAIFCNINGKCRLIGIVTGKDSDNGLTGTYWNGSAHVAIPSSQYGWELDLSEETLYSSYNKTYGADVFKIGKVDISLGKSLSVNLDDTVRPTSIEGCSNKGMLFIDGEEISGTSGALEGKLNELSAADSPFSRGFPISNIKGNEISSNFSDYKFNIMTDINETSISKHHTVSSTTEMAVIMTETLDNELSLITLAPIFPVVLAKTASNNRDTRLTNSQGIYFVNTQGLPNGGFLHYLNSETNNLGASITFSNPGYINDGGGTDGIDYRFEDNYGNYIWRYTGLQDGNSSLVWNNAYLDRVWNVKYSDVDYEINKMYGTNSAVSGFAAACRVEYDGTVRAWNYQSHITDHWLQLNSPEGREGFYPLEGTRFWDISKMTTDMKNQPLRYDPTITETFSYKKSPLESYFPSLSRRVGDLTAGSTWTNNTPTELPFTYKTKYESFDCNIENFYLFSIGDLYPDSYKRSNSIAYINRDLSNYGITFKSKGLVGEANVEHECYGGSIADTLQTDASYETMPIHSSSKNTSEFKRFGLLRLIEVTYDWHFNEVDYENLPDIVLNERKTGYIENQAFGGVTELDITLYNSGASDFGEPFINGCGIDGNFGNSATLPEGIFYYTTRQPIHNYPTNTALDLKYIYTDFNNFATTSKSIFGDNQTEQLTFTVTQDPYTTAGGSGHTDGSWHIVQGILNANLASSVTQQPASANAGTYSNVVATSTSGNGRGYTCTIILDSASNVSSIIYKSVNLTFTNDFTAKHRGSKYAQNDTITFAKAQFGSSQDIIVTVGQNDIITENRIYCGIDIVAPYALANDSEFLEPIRNTTTKKWAYTGFIKVRATGPDKLSVFNTTKKHYSNNGDFISATSPDSVLETAPNFSYFFNYTHILGSLQQNNELYKGFKEDTGLSGQNAAEKQDSYHLFIPLFLSTDQSPTRSNKFDPIATNALKNSRLIGNGINFELSRVIDKLSQWQEDSNIIGTINATTNPLGHGPFHLYTDMWGIIKRLKKDNQSMIGFGEYSESHESDGHDHPNELDDTATDDVSVTKSHNSQTIEEEVYSGSTLPNLHIGYMETDQRSKWPSLRFSYNFEDNSSWSAKEPYNFDGNSEIKGFKFLSASNINARLVTEKDLSRCDTQYGAEVYYKPTFNTLAANVTKIELDSLTQSSGITGTPAVKPNSRTKGRLQFKIEEIDITTNANNGKNGAGGVIPFPKINQWLQFANDLTGHYLVSETPTSSSITANTKVGRNFIQESIPENIHQIVSHTMNHTGTTVIHYIEIDNVTYTNNAADIDVFYRVMRIAKDCTFEFTPNEIELNKLTNRFTRVPDTNSCHTSVGASQYYPWRGSTRVRPEATNESVLSMYLGLDVDGKPNDDYVVRRSLDSIATDNGTSNSFINNKSYSMLLTDGLNDYNQDVFFSKNGTNSNLIRLSSMRNMKGIISFGETFSITTFKSPKNFLAKRCNIGSTVDIVDEVDEIVNGLLETNNINYDTKYENNTDMYYTGNKYIGGNGFYTVTELLRYKNKRLIIDGKTIEKREMLPLNFYTDIRLSEDDQSSQITELKRTQSSFDKFNIVTVYGDGVKGHSRNRKSIKSTGREIEKEITDLSIKTQKGVDDKAESELSLIGALDTQVEFRVPRERIPYLKAGQVITLAYPSQEIETGYYQVLEIQNTFGRLPKLTVGRYSQDMASSFAALNLKNIETAGLLRGDKYISGSKTVQEDIETTIKDRKLVVIQTSGISTLAGFNNLIGFNSTVGFFHSTGVTNTTILDIDLME